jgi:hypothetical protein
VPKRPVTEVTNVSCASTTVTKGFQIELAALHSPGGTAALQSFVFGSSPDGAVFTFGLVATTKLFYSAGSIPLLEVDPFVYGTSLGLDCTISGYTHS